jgi:hypothetical protein
MLLVSLDCLSSSCARTKINIPETLATLGIQGTGWR